MPDHDLQHLAETLGIQLTDVYAYTDLLAHRSVTKEDIATVCGLDPEATSTLVHRLLRVGMLADSVQEPGMFRCISPEYVIRTATAARHRTIAEERAAIDRLEVGLTEVSDVVRQKRREEATGAFLVLRGNDSVNSQLHELFSTSRDECCEPSVTYIARRHVPSDLSAQASRGVDRSATSSSDQYRLLLLDSHVHHYEHFEAPSTSIGVIPSLQQPFFVRPQEWAMVIDNDADDVVAVYTELPLVVSLVSAHAEELWSSARKIKDSHEKSPAEVLSAQDRALIKGLLEGRKDADVAKMLGISSRTLRRRLSEIMNRLSCRSRFELAYRIGSLSSGARAVDRDRPTQRAHSMSVAG